MYISSNILEFLEGIMLEIMRMLTVEEFVKAR